jgi:hypothetical protein
MERFIGLFLRGSLYSPLSAFRELDGGRYYEEK